MKQTAIFIFAILLFVYPVLAEPIVAYKGEVQELNTRDLFYSVGLTENTPEKIDACALTPTYMLYFDNSTDTVSGWNTSKKQWEQGKISELYAGVDGPIDAFTYIPSLDIYEIISGDRVWFIQDNKISDTSYPISEIAAEQCAGLEKCPDSADAFTFYKDAQGKQQFVWVVNDNRELDIWFSKDEALHYNRANLDDVGFFNGRMDSVDALCTFPDGSLLAFGEGEYTGSGAGEIGPNTKLMSKYSDKEVFLISDRDWREVLPLVPVTTWTDEGGQVHKYPTLIYHEEVANNLYLYFNEPYEEGHTVVGDVEMWALGGGFRQEGSFSKSSNLQPGDEVTLNWTIWTYDGAITSLRITQKPDFIEFVDPEDGIIDNINSGFPNGRTFKFTFRVREDVEMGSEAFDADSALYFMEQYGSGSTTVIGQTPQNLDDLLGSESQRIYPEDYLSYWEKFNRVVYSEENYELALLASAYSSLINAPLVIKGTTADSENVFNGRTVICVGEVNPKGADCAEMYNLGQLREKYLQKTNTDKLLLVNPGDLDIYVGEPFTPEEGGESIGELYSRNSLAAPFLAAAKHELLLSTTSNNYQEVDSFIDSKIKSLGIGAKYLTIVASPNAIEMAYLHSSGRYASADAWQYSKIDDGDSFLDLATGRIFGLTVADTSSNIARSLFYDETLKNSNNVLVTRGDSFVVAPARVYVLGKAMSTTGYNTTITPAGTNSEDWKNKFFISYLDHGGFDWAGFFYDELPYLDNPAIITLACMTCAFDKEYKIDFKGEYDASGLFCANAIRKGAVAFVGATDVSGMITHSCYMSELFAKESTMGEAFMNCKNAELLVPDPYFTRAENNFTNSILPWYTLIGDPTLNVSAKHKLPRTQTKLISEGGNGAEKTYRLTVPALKVEIPDEITGLCEENWQHLTDVPFYFTTAFSKLRYEKNGFDYYLFAEKFKPIESFQPKSVSEGWTIDSEFSKGREYLWLTSPTWNLEDLPFKSGNEYGFTNFDFDITLSTESLPDLAVQNVELTGNALTFEVANVGKGKADVSLNNIRTYIYGYDEEFELYYSHSIGNTEISLAPNQDRSFVVDVPEEYGDYRFNDFDTLQIFVILDPPADFKQESRENDGFMGWFYK